jgi:hypothetical protein
LIGIVEPIPDAAISLISPDTGTVAHVDNLVISQDAEPYEGFPTADQMAQILESSG